MQSELDVRARLAATEAQQRSLSAEIGPLQRIVKAGDDGWRMALERLAECHKQRRMLEERHESLCWVLAQESDAIAS
jgi:hypothetical protein